MASDLDSVIQDFLVESYENLDQLDRDLVALEQNPDAVEAGYERASLLRELGIFEGCEARLSRTPAAHADRLPRAQ